MPHGGGHAVAIPQVREKKTFLGALETSDCGKPIDEAEWDMVRTDHGLRGG